VAEFAVRVDHVTARLGDLGEVLGDSRVVRKVLRIVPRRLKQLVVSIEIHGDLNKMTLDELVGQLEVAEDADTEDEPTAKGGSGDQLLLTRASGRLVRVVMQAASVVTVAAMEGIMTTTSAARARDVGGAAIEAGASMLHTWAHGEGIDGQMGQARWAGTRTARKSTTL
jgi:hypothetical protein